MTMVVPTSWLLTALVAMTCASGCALPKRGQSKQAEDVAPLRDQRREEALKQFETHRDLAQYQSAIQRWQAGDPYTCEAQLRALIGRNPNNFAARQALADLAIERGELAQAETELRELLKLQPDHAATHHALGLLLESQQRLPESRAALARAAELEPDNMLYRLCSQADLDGANRQASAEMVSQE